MTPAEIDRYWELLRYPATASRRSNASPGLSSGAARPNSRGSPRRTLILWGREDRFIPVASAAYFARALPHSRTIIYDHVGHLPMEEVPDRSAADVAAFLGGCQPGVAAR